MKRTPLRSIGKKKAARLAKAGVKAYSTIERRPAKPKRKKPLGREIVESLPEYKWVRRTPVRRKKRSPEEFARIYGSKARVEWVKTQPCFALSIPGAGPCEGPIDNCHTGTGGMGYKAGSETIVAGCRRHHRRFDRYKAPFDRMVVRDTIQAVAYLTDHLWDRLQRT